MLIVLNKVDLIPIEKRQLTIAKVLYVNFTYFISLKLFIKITDIIIVIISTLGVRFQLISATVHWFHNY